MMARVTAAAANTPRLPRICTPHQRSASAPQEAPWFSALAAIGLVTSFTSTLMFTALGSFFNKISDPGERVTGR